MGIRSLEQAKEWVRSFVPLQAYETTVEAFPRFYEYTEGERHCSILECFHTMWGYQWDWVVCDEFGADLVKTSPFIEEM